MNPREQKTCLKAALRVLGCLLALAAVLPALFGNSGTASAEGDRALEAALQLLYQNEGSYGSVNPDDNGAVSIGKIQWHATRALDLTKTIAALNPSSALRILGEALYGEILSSSDWSGRTVSESEQNALSALLVTPEGKQAQDELAEKDVSAYLSAGRALGLRNTAVLIYYADLRNQGGPRISRRIAEQAAQAAGSYDAVTLDDIHSAALADSALGNYPLRRGRTYNYCLQYVSALPEGEAELISGGIGTVRVAGWAKDSDTPGQSPEIHVYVGGDAASGASRYAVSCTFRREEFGDACGFDWEIVVSEYGDQPVFIYAVDTQDGGITLIGSGEVSILRNHEPVGNVAMISGGLGTVTVSGWAFDEDTPEQPVWLHLYVGGDVASGAPCYPFLADGDSSFPDGRHGFDRTVPVSPSGTQPVWLYALNTSFGSNSLLGVFSVTIQEDRIPPTIGSVRISDVSSEGYTISCDVSDNAGVRKVTFPAWTADEGDPSDLSDGRMNSTVGQIENGHASCRVLISEHAFRTGCVYRNRICAWDWAGNLFTLSSDQVPELDVYVPSPREAALILPAQLTRIEEEAFAGLRIEAVYCPESLREIGARAFADCVSLKEIYIPAATQIIHETAFDGCPDSFTIICPANSAAAGYAKMKGIPYLETE